VRINDIVANSSRREFYTALGGVELKAAPGARFQYSNAGAQLAGYVAERVYGQDYETLLRRLITSPLGMRDTAIELTPAQAARLAPGHEQDGTILAQETSNFQGAGAIKSTVKDMLVYARWQLDESDPVVALSHKATYNNENFSIGLNWQVVREGQRRVIWQDGALPGYASFCILQPESKLTLVILSNELDSKTLGRLSEMANRIMIAVEPLSVPKP
jgi:D-alanyl-D-alanine-carboxypeptidase/D-alanyl-D-alanine-endopeptidase